LTKPDLVQRNDIVTLTYATPGITLTMRGKALESGAEGDSIAVLNEQTKRTLQGIVTGPGRVSFSLDAPRYAANLPASGR
jgi:flagella basal body P-ring formation protein FlgA